MERLLELAPYKPFCSDNKTASNILPFSMARNKEYIQINQPTKVCWLVFDIDEPNPHIWEDRLLPPPNIITITPETGTSHLCYAIDPVCISKNGNPKIVSYMRAVQRAFVEKLGADRDYHSPVTKNPLHPKYRVLNPTDYVYSLGELAEYVDLNKGQFRNTKHQTEDGIVTNAEGRNCTLFDSLRVWAYQYAIEARDSGNYERWYKRVLDKSEQLNGRIAKKLKKSPLPHAEVKSTAKSVAKFCWEKYNGSKIKRGIMEMAGTDIPLKSKQRLSARRTHKIKGQTSLNKIEGAVRIIAAKQEKINKSNVGRYAGLTRQTVGKYWDHVEKIIKENEEKLQEQRLLAKTKRENKKRKLIKKLKKAVQIENQTYHPPLFDP